MSDCGCQSEAGEQQRPVLRLALGLNGLMGIIGTAAGLWAQSAGLLADALDMFCDAIAYGIALAAIGRAASFKARAASVSGWLLVLLAIGVLIEVGRRALHGSEPQSLWMLATAALSLGVNITVLKLLRRLRSGEVHLRAAWIFTRADVIANIAVILSGVLVLLTANRYFDLIVGAAIGLYVGKESFEILRDAHREQDPITTPTISS